MGLRNPNFCEDCRQACMKCCKHKTGFKLHSKTNTPGIACWSQIWALRFKSVLTVDMDVEISHWALWARSVWHVPHFDYFNLAMHDSSAESNAGDWLSNFDHFPFSDTFGVHRVLLFWGLGPNQSAERRSCPKRELLWFPAGSLAHCTFLQWQKKIERQNSLRGKVNCWVIYWNGQSASKAVPDHILATKSEWLEQHRTLCTPALK